MLTARDRVPHDLNKMKRKAHLHTRGIHDAKKIQMQHRNGPNIPLIFDEADCARNAMERQQTARQSCTNDRKFTGTPLRSSDAIYYPDKRYG